VVACLAYLRDGTLGSSSTITTTAAAAAAAASPPPPLPAGALLISPAIDFTASSVFGPKLAEYFHKQPTEQQQPTKQQQPGEADQGGGDGTAAPAAFDGQWDYIDADEGSAVAKHYVQAASMADMCNPYVSPMVLPSFKGLVQQKMAVVWGGVEVLGPDCARFASRMQADGVRVETHVEKNQPHVYCVLPPKELLEKGAAVIVPFFASLCGV
jgi:acetyl esterase/lipase